VARAARLRPLANPPSNAAFTSVFAAITTTPAAQALARRVEAGGVLSVPGACLAAQPFLAVLLRRLFPKCPIVIVAPGVKPQESFQQDLETWLGGGENVQRPTPNVQRSVHFFPAWDILPNEAKLPHADVISERLEALVALGDPAAPAPLINTQPVALMQRTFAPADLHARRRRLTRGDRLNPLDLVEWLEAQGYEPEAKVTQKGELSLRGGIVDVFPPTSPWPVRLEFFGDELESLRTFDPGSQISREEIAELVLPPAGELGILKQSLAGNTTTPTTEPPALATLLDHLPPETILLLCEPEIITEHAEAYAAQAPGDDPFLADWAELIEQVKSRGLTVLEVTEGTAAPEVDDLTSTDNPHLSAAGYRGDAGHSPSPRPSPAGRGSSPPADSSLTPWFSSLDAFRPLGECPPEPHIAEAQRREFFAQLHRWLRQGHAVHVVCNNEGERQRFEEVWKELGDGGWGLASGVGAQNPRPQTPDPRPEIHLGALARGFLCEDAGVVVVTDAEIFGRYKVQRPRRLKSPHAVAVRSALDIDFTELAEGDYVVHLQHGIGRYRGLKFLARGDDGTGAEHLVIEYAPADPAQQAPLLYVPVTEAHLVGKYVGAGKARPALNTLGGKRWEKTKQQAERAVRDLAAELLSIQAARETQAGHAFKPDTPWQREFEASFLFEETPDQQRAIDDAKRDMERAKPMDRLVCGDVGFGKTEVAIRAAFKAVMDGRQVAILVPTTVLAQQHFNTFRERMADYPVRIELLSRFRTKREQQKVIADLVAGAVDIVIGTHRLVQDDVHFKDLGLVVIDEEQRFGVMHKEKFKLLRKLVDVLTLSATPIPRTLYLALTGARDMSTIQTPPHDRLPVETIVTHYDERLIRDAIQRELNRDGQVFFLHNRVETIEVMRQKLATIVPQARVVVGHGQMHADDLEEVMTKFVNGEADVLLSTTIIESGLDIPNANTLIIDRADRFGLSQLYQLRGRVGRYKHQAFAYLLLPRHARLLTDVRKRMNALKQYAQLGSGFKIAMRDLEIRGAGNLLGAQQSGHITAVGFELYCQLLKQSVSALKGEKVKPRVEVRVALDFLEIGREAVSAAESEQAVPPRAEHERLLSPSLSSIQNGGEGARRAGEEASAGQQAARSSTGQRRDRSLPLPAGEGRGEGEISKQRDGGRSAHLPLNYIPEPQHRIEAYRKLAQADDRDALESLRAELRDRFGPLPPPVERLLLVTELKLLAGERAVTVIETREDKLMLTRHDDFVQMNGKFPRLTKKTAEARLKEIKKLLLALG
jgi:transcription-repair coupling factor (superfamily II helicase)